MKRNRILAVLIIIALIAAGFAACAQTPTPAVTPTPAAEAPTPGDTETDEPDEPATPEWAPSRNIEWMITSGPGGGSDIFTRTIADIMSRENIVTNTIIAQNLTTGGGEVGRNQVATMSAGPVADHTLLTFNSGDLMPMVQNTANRLENFTSIAVMAVDKQIILSAEHTTFADFYEAVEAARAGESVIVGGSRGDDHMTFDMLLTEVGLTSDDIPYITFDSTAEAIAAILGGHLDFVVAKPAAASEFVDAGMLIPELALSNERFGGNLASAPTVSEIGDGQYNNVEFPVWRSVVGPASMSPEAAAFWSEALRQVSLTDTWIYDYLEQFMLINAFMSMEESFEYQLNFQTEFMEMMGLN